MAESLTLTLPLKIVSGAPVVCVCFVQDVESYIHRSGRTGRAGRDGTCVLFFKPNEEHCLSYVEQKAVCLVRTVIGGLAVKTGPMANFFFHLTDSYSAIRL